MSELREQEPADSASEAAEEQVSRQRELSYRFLSAMLLDELTAEFLQAAAACPPVTEGRLGNYFCSLPAGDAAGIEQARIDAAAEFAALLLNMSAAPVAVYESVYTSPEHLMMQEARDQVLALYRAEGFRVDGWRHLPEDHLGFELEFMACLCARESQLAANLDAAGLGRCRLAQRTFLADHLLTWVFDFCKDLDSKARSPLYAGVAETLARFMEFEREEFGIGEA